MSVLVSRLASLQLKVHHNACATMKALLNGNIGMLADKI